VEGHHEFRLLISGGIGIKAAIDGQAVCVLQEWGKPTWVGASSGGRDHGTAGMKKITTQGVDRRLAQHDAGGRSRGHTKVAEIAARAGALLFRLTLTGNRIKMIPLRAQYRSWRREAIAHKISVITLSGETTGVAAGAAPVLARDGLRFHQREVCQSQMTQKDVCGNKVAAFSKSDGSPYTGRLRRETPLGLRIPSPFSLAFWLYNSLSLPWSSFLSGSIV
jgi:hypothetical protein